MLAMRHSSTWSQPPPDLTKLDRRAITTWNYDPQRGWLSSKRYADNQGPNYTYYPSGRLHTRI